MYYDIIENKIALINRLCLKSYHMFDNEYSVMPKQIDCLTNDFNLKTFDCAILTFNGIVLEMSFKYLIKTNEIKINQVYSNYPLPQYTPINVKLTDNSILVQAVNKDITDIVGNNQQKLISYIRRN